MNKKKSVSGGVFFSCLFANTMQAILLSFLFPINFKTHKLFMYVEKTANAEYVWSEVAPEQVSLFVCLDFCLELAVLGKFPFRNVCKQL